MERIDGKTPLADGALELEDIGPSVLGRTVTATLLVSHNGSGTDGKTWDTAYKTPYDALAAASTDPNECTLILIAPRTGALHYDMNADGDPTFSGNYILSGTHRTWAKIMNDHETATSIMKFTGYASIINLNINLGTSLNGVIMTKGASRVNRCQFVGENLTSEAIALQIGDGGATTAKWGRLSETYYLGDATKSYMTALKLNNAKYTFINDFEATSCKIGLHVVHADTDTNVLNMAGLDACDTGIQIDAGNGQYFQDVRFYGNTNNVVDSVGDSNWISINGSFPITIKPDNFTGVVLATNATADTWGSLATVFEHTGDGPFRVVETALVPAISEKYRVQFYDNGTSFDDVIVDTTKNLGSAFPSGTGFIFNKGTTIKARAKCEGAGPDNIAVWIGIQEV